LFLKANRWYNDYTSDCALGEGPRRFDNAGEHPMSPEQKDKCSDCRHFAPKPDQKLFNCTAAKHAGLGYGMQVRADSRACDAFVPKQA
jgi:hypothetical protein